MKDIFSAITLTIPPIGRKMDTTEYKNNENNLGTTPSDEYYNNNSSDSSNDNSNSNNNTTTPTKPKKIRKYEYETITVREGGRPTPSSKYDFVKVKVWLEDHYYILSRFLVSRVLNVTKVDQIDAVKIALELKKRLVDQGMMNVTQLEMENQLFQILKGYGYGNEYIQRYRMTTKFHHQRVPLIILITGTRCVGKSWLATQLAERLNLSTVLQTSLVYDLMYTIMHDLPSSVSSPYPPADPVPLIYRAKDKASLLEEYQRECKMVREGVDTDIEKCLEEGKAIIIEGPNLDPSLFIELLNNRSIPVSNPLPPLLSPSFTSPPMDSRHHHHGHHDAHHQHHYYYHPTPVSSTATELVPPLSSLSLSSSPPTIPPPTTEIKTPKDPVSSEAPSSSSSSSSSSTATSPSTSESPAQPIDEKETEKKEKDKDKKKKGITKGIIVPFVLSVNETDHKLMVENWLSCSTRDQEFVKLLGNDSETQANALVARLQHVQEYLLQQVPPFHRVEVNAQSLLDTLSVLHSAVLDRIQQVYTDEGFSV